MNLFDLSRRVGIVTGGNGGIGLGMAKGLAACGAKVAIAGRNAEKNAAAVAELEALGAEALGITVEVCDEGSVQAMVAEAVDRLGRLDILINNAGTNIRKMPEEYALAEWQQVLDTNLTSAFLCSQAAYPAMKAAGGGKIIMNGSMMSIFGQSFTAPYGASKGGVMQLARSLAVAWAKDNIQVNTLLPGWIDTDLTRKARSDFPSLHDKVVGRTPAGHWGKPDDFMGITAFLASPASDFVTGTAIPVDGGYSIAG